MRVRSLPFSDSDRAARLSGLLLPMLLAALLAALAPTNEASAESSIEVIEIEAAGAEIGGMPASAGSHSPPWPQWRGPERDGRVGGDVWPADLKGLERLWRVELQPSYSGPIVGEDRVFTTETRDERTEVVSAHDRATGERLWSTEWEGAMKVPFFAAKNGSWIRSTPAFDGSTLFVGGMLERLVALDGTTGAIRWQIDFPRRQGVSKAPFGFVCSPLLDGDHLYVEAAGALWKLHKETGEVVWRSEGFSTGGMASEGTFSSPVLAELGGLRQVLVQTREALKGVLPETGEVLWSVEIPSFRGMNILTPVAYGDRVFTSSYRNGSYLVAVDRRGDGWTAERVWENSAQAYMSSPVLVDDVIYLHLGNGRLTALDLEQRERLWTTRPFGSYWSMITRDDRVLALDSAGELVLFQASPEEFRLLDQRQVADSETWAHLALAGDQLIVRELDALTAWRWKPAPAASKAKVGGERSSDAAP